MEELLTFIAEWFNSTVYSFFVDLVAYVFQTLFILWWKLQVAGLQFAWDIAKSSIQSLGLNSALQSAWGSLPFDVQRTAAFFRFPEAVNILLTAGVTRLVMSFIPGL